MVAVGRQWRIGGIYFPLRAKYNEMSLQNRGTLSILPCARGLVELSFGPYGMHRFSSNSGARERATCRTTLNMSTL
jgi:hypothetical protein